MREEKQIQEVLDQLSVLAPSEQDSPMPAAKMLAQIRQKTAPAAPRRSLWQRWLAPGRRLAPVLALLTILLAASFAFAPVRAAASDFLGLFRVQKFAAISISPEQIAILQEVAESGMVPGELTVYDAPEQITAVSSIQEAERMTGLAPVRTVANRGAPAEIYVTEGGAGEFVIDLESARAIMEMVGADPLLLPDAIDQQAVNIILYAGVQQMWADGTMLLQTDSPSVDYPAGVDPTALGEALLQLLGLSADEASRLAQQIDWTSTLLLPIPTDIGTFNEVTVDGVSGLYLSPLDGGEGMLLWQKNGRIYALSASGNMADLLNLASQLD